MHSNSTVYLENARMIVKCAHIPANLTESGLLIKEYERLWIEAYSEDHSGSVSVILTMTLAQLGELSQQIERHIQDKEFEEQAESLEAAAG